MYRNLLFGFTGLIWFTACKSTSSSESGYGPRLQLKQSIKVSSNFESELGKVGQKAGNFCFSIVDSDGSNSLYVQPSPCKISSTNGILLKIDSVAPGEGLSYRGVEIGKFNPTQLTIDSLCTGDYRNTCSLTLGLGSKTASISLKKVSDQGMVQKTDDKALFQYIVQDQGTQFEVFLTYKTLDDLVDGSTCKESSGNAVPDFFNVYLNNAQADTKIFPSSIIIDKATGKSNSSTAPIIKIDPSGRLLSVDSAALKFEIIKTANGSTHQAFSKVLCTSIGYLPADSKYQVQEIPIYGNWCGPGYGGEEAEVPPAIDGVDRACMRHDLCYAARRYNDCNCDGRLLSEMPGESASSSEGEAARIAILAYFTAAPCICTKRVCVLGACRNISIPSVGGTCPG